MKLKMARGRTHTHTTTLSLSLSHTHTHTTTHSLSLSLTHTHSHSHNHTHTLSLSLIHTHTHTHTHSQRERDTQVFTCVPHNHLRHERVVGCVFSQDSQTSINNECRSVTAIGSRLKTHSNSSRFSVNRPPRGCWHFPAYVLHVLPEIYVRTFYN